MGSGPRARTTAPRLARPRVHPRTRSRRPPRSRPRARRGTCGSQGPAEDAEARGEDIETERAVQRERAFVRQLGVDVDAVATVLPHPVEAGGDEGAPPPAPPLDRAAGR